MPNHIIPVQRAPLLNVANAGFYNEQKNFLIWTAEVYVYLIDPIYMFLPDISAVH